MISSENRADDDPTRHWLFDCEAMEVDGPDGPVGRVLEPLYRPSARWDRPWALAVRSESGEITVPIEAVSSVDRAARRIHIDRPGRELPRGSSR